MSIHIKAVLDFGKDFWKENRLLSGKKVDALRGQNIPHNARSIDRTAGLNCIISHKSTDLRKKSYLLKGSIYRLGMKYVRQLVAYAGEVRKDHKIKATYHLHWPTEDPNCERILEWFIPPSTISASHTDDIKRIIEETTTLKITIHIYQVLDY